MGSRPFKRCSATSKGDPVRLEEVIAEIEEVSRRFPFILEVIKLDETKYSVKYLLPSRTPKNTSSQQKAPERFR
jgi:hypothetical protein